MDDEVYFSGDEEWEQVLVQALEQTGDEDYCSGDEVWEQAMLQTLDRLEEEDWEWAMVQSVDQAEQQAAWEKESKRKRSIIQIKNQDELCCARAIVTMRAWCHRNDPGCMPRNNWETLRNGYPRQGVYARQLHQATGVPEGPCSLPELETFQRHLAPTYQLKVMSRHHPFVIIFRGPDAPHLIMLLKGGNHYEGCTTFSGFLKKRYWCHFCDKAVSNKRKHACQRQT